MHIMNFELSGRLREARKDTGLTQREVADHLGLAEAVSVGRWERGETKPTIDRLLELAELYGVPVEWLLGKDDRPAAA